jgi:hypothetical protein
MQMCKMLAILQLGNAMKLQAEERQSIDKDGPKRVDHPGLLAVPHPVQP